MTAHLRHPPQPETPRRAINHKTHAIMGGATQDTTTTIASSSKNDHGDAVSEEDDDSKKVAYFMPLGGGVPPPIYICRQRNFIEIGWSHGGQCISGCFRQAKNDVSKKIGLRKEEEENMSRWRQALRR